MDKVNKNRSKEEMAKELEALRQRVSELEELNARSKKLSNIFSSLKDLIFVLDKEGRFSELYVPGEELYMPSEEFIDKKLSEVMPAKVYELFSKALEKNQNGEIDEYEYSLDIAGKEQWYSAKQSPLFSEGQFSGVVVIIRNITRQKQLIKQIKESEERYRALVDLGGKVGEAVVMMQDSDKVEGVQTFVSDEWSRITGYSKEELLGMSFFDLLIPKDRRASLDRHRKKINGMNIPDHFQMSIIRKDGIKVPIELTSAFSMYQGKRANVAYISDITERKQVEKELKVSREQLRGLAGYLESVREEERCKIARNIHDELGQTLAGLKIDLSWLSKGLSKEQKSLFEKTRSMSKVVDTTIQMVKKIAVELRPGVLDDLGISAAIEWQVGEFEKLTKIESEFSSNPRDIILDQERSIVIFRIFQEILTNIIRHANATKVKVSLKEKGGSIILKVCDNGKGISKKQIADPKSFGLIGMRERVRPWKGNIGISSGPSEGTTLEVSIPRVN
ncbi:MAG: PAS domain S-box protein [Dehalococcoidia bacterium]|nr:MAG: PAS domain S-box protein [Dehalococcoidia bacterium]